jgi:concanavalin A-like lectin/glucanase superfamily protein
MLGSGLTSFNPKEFTNLALWLDAANPSNNGTLPANNSSLTTWVDVTGVSGNAVSAGHPATFVTNNQNGLPGISFSSSSSTSLMISSTSALVLSTGFSIFIVGTLTTNVNAVWINKRLSGGAIDFQVGFTSSTASQYCNNSTCVAGTTSSIVNLTQLYTFTTNSGGTNMYVNTSSIYNDSTSNLPTSEAADVYIGSDRGNQNFFNGYFNEILIFNGQLSAAQTTLVNQYLMRKWHLASSF